MDKSFFSKVKKSTPFKKADLLLYVVAIILTAVAFLCVFLGKSNANNGFVVSIDNQTIIEYDFTNNTYFLTENTKDLEITTSIDDEKILFTIKSGNNLDKINVLTIDKKNKSVKVSDANCPHGDCKSFSPITTNGKQSIIYCASHDLKITSNDGGYRPPVSGE